MRSRTATSARRTCFTGVFGTPMYSRVTSCTPAECTPPMRSTAPADATHIPGLSPRPYPGPEDAVPRTPPALRLRHICAARRAGGRHTSAPPSAGPHAAPRAPNCIQTPRDGRRRPARAAVRRPRPCAPIRQGPRACAMVWRLDPGVPAPPGAACLRHGPATPAPAPRSRAGAAPAPWP